MVANIGVFISILVGYVASPTAGNQTVAVVAQQYNEILSQWEKIEEMLSCHLASCPSDQSMGPFSEFSQFFIRQYGWVEYVAELVCYVFLTLTDYGIGIVDKCLKTYDVEGVY